MYAAHHKVDNLIAIVDVNGQQIDGPVGEVMDVGALHRKYGAFGWQVFEGNGNDMEGVVSTLEEAKRHTGHKRPVVFLMSTAMGCGVDFMMNNHKWHGVAPNDEELAAALAQLPETLGDF